MARADRGVSDVLGYVLVFALILGAVAFVTVAGLSTLESAKNAEQANNAERAFDVLAHNIDDVFRRGAPARATELSLGEAQIYTNRTTTINVTLVEAGGGTTTHEHQVTSLVFEGNGATTFVYEAGAVFRVEREGGLVLKEPPLTFSEERTMIPIVKLQRETRQSMGGSTILIRTRGDDRSVLEADADTSGPAFQRIVFNVTGSAQQALWRDYLETEAGLSCSESGNALDCETTWASGPEQAFVVLHKIDVKLDP